MNAQHPGRRDDGGRRRMTMKMHVSVLLVLGVSLSMGFLAVAPARPAGPAGSIALVASSAPSATWWVKANALASGAAADLAARSTSTVSVGPTIDGSNERGPQSEPAI